ncbi:MAG: mechanosensitive ion channel [Arenicellales bacterium]|jgi:small conductance mechanosensitive channel|nr:mechanosensitive ion channel [Arenicellales bacterium]|tara:strand:+ start:98 stop:607 length:510 start_codon:yes stop_codon:yes gene_type:complete
MKEELTKWGNYLLAHSLEWLVFPVILLVGYFILKMIDKYVERFFDRVEYDRTLEVLIQKTVRVFLSMIVLIIALSNVGFDVSGFIAGLGVMGFIVGFAVKDVLSNLAAGIFLIVKRPFNLGEVIDVAGVKGKVEQMTLSSCVVITDDQQYVTIPNTKIWGNPIRNLSRL